MITKIAWIFGVFCILIGVCGFVPALVSGGLLFELFATGMKHNAIYIISGALALLAAWSGGGYPRLYFKLFGILYAIATVIGFLQGDTILGLETITTADNFLHLAIALVALWAGFGETPKATTQPEAAIR